MTTIHHLGVALTRLYRTKMTRDRFINRSYIASIILVSKLALKLKMAAA